MDNVFFEQAADPHCILALHPAQNGVSCAAPWRFPRNYLKNPITWDSISSVVDSALRADKQIEVDISGVVNSVFNVWDGIWGNIPYANCGLFIRRTNVLVFRVYYSSNGGFYDFNYSVDKFPFDFNVKVKRFTDKTIIKFNNDTEIVSEHIWRSLGADPPYNLVMSEFDGNLKCIKVTDMDARNVLCNAMYRDMSTEYKYKDFSLTSNAKAFSDYQSAVDSAFDPTHDYSFFIEYDVSRSRTEASIFYAGANGLPAGLYFHNNNSIRVYTNLLYDPASTTTSYMGANLTLTSPYGYHTSQLDIVGNTFKAYFNGQVVAHITEGLSRTESPAVSIPQCNSGIIYSAKLTDLTTGDVVWEINPDDIRAIPSPSPEYKTYDLRKNFKDTPTTWNLSAYAANYASGFKFEISCDIDDYIDGYYNIFGDEYNFPLLIQTAKTESSDRIIIYSIQDTDGTLTYNSLTTITGVNGHHAFTFEYDGAGNLTITHNETATTHTVSFATISSLTGKTEIGKNYILKWYNAANSPVWISSAVSTCNRITHRELYDKFSESTSGWMLICRFNADFTGIIANTQYLLCPTNQGKGWWITYIGDKLLIMYQSGKSTDTRVILCEVATPVFKDCTVSVQRYGTTLFTYVYADGKGIGNDSRTVPADDLMLYTDMGDSFFSQFFGVLNSVEYREYKYGYKGLTMYETYKFPSPGERGGMLSKSYVRSDFGVFSGMTGYKLFSSIYMWSTEKDSIVSIGEHDCIFAIKYRINGLYAGVNSVFYHNSQNGSVNIAFGVSNGVVSSNYSYLKLTDVSLEIPVSSISSIGEHEVIISRTGTSVQVTVDGTIVVANSSGTTINPVYSTDPYSYFNGYVGYAYWQDVTENKTVWQTTYAETHTALPAEVTTSLDLRGVVSSYTVFVDFEATDFDSIETGSAYQTLVGQGSAAYDSLHIPICAITYYRNGASYMLQMAHEANNTRMTASVTLPSKLIGRHTLCGVVDITSGTSTQLKVYLDGAQVASSVINAYPTGNSYGAAYGLWPALPSNVATYYGKIYSLRLYDTVFSDEEIKALSGMYSCITLTWPEYLAEQIMHRCRENAFIYLDKEAYNLKSGSSMRTRPGQKLIGLGADRTILNNTAVWVDRSGSLSNVTCNTLRMCSYSDDQLYTKEITLKASNVKSGWASVFATRSAISDDFTVDYETARFEDCESTDSYYIGTYSAVQHTGTINKAYFNIKNCKSVKGLYLGPNNYGGTTLHYKDYAVDISGYNVGETLTASHQIYIGGLQGVSNNNVARKIQIDNLLVNIDNVNINEIVCLPRLVNGNYTLDNAVINIKNTNIGNAIYLCSTVAATSGVTRSMNINNITCRIDVSDSVTYCNGVQYFNNNMWTSGMVVTGEVKCVITGKGQNLISKNEGGEFRIYGGAQSPDADHPTSVLEFDTFISHDFNCVFKAIDKYVFTNYNDIVITGNQDPASQSASVWEFNPPANAKSGYVYNVVRGSKEFLTGLDTASKVIDGVSATKSGDNLYTAGKWELEVIDQNILQLRRLESVYETIQQTVRDGNAATEFGIGYTFETVTPRWTITWEAVGFDQVQAADSSLTHTMTLVAVKAVQNLQFDAPEDGFSNGNSKWSTSNIRQWLNSNKEAGSWFTPASDTDAAPDYAATLDGFMYDLPQGFIEIVARAKVTTALNFINNYGEEITEDYFWLPSYTELSGNLNNVSEGTQMTKYVGASASAKVKYNHNNTAVIWWMRSPLVEESSNVRVIDASGSAFYTRAKGTTMWAVPCCIIA